MLGIRRLALLLGLAAAGCATGPENGRRAAASPHVDQAVETRRGAPSKGDPTGFCAVCEEKHGTTAGWVGPFAVDHLQAERDAFEHSRKHPGHEARIIRACPETDE